MIQKISSYSSIGLSKFIAAKIIAAKFIAGFLAGRFGPHQARCRVRHVSLAVLTLAFAAALPAHSAGDPSSAANAKVQVSSLEVKSRIASMEQVNVTAEKSIDPAAPAASEEVTSLLAELLELDAEQSRTTAESAQPAN